MATSASTSSSSFTRAVITSMRRLYPESLADKSFDNTGLLLEAPLSPSRPPQNNSVLLANDLTSAVTEEAIERRDSVLVAYHPIIFHALKSLTLADHQQRSLLRLAAEGISVYCPHTAVDAVEGGNGDWLGDIVTGEVTEALQDIGPSQGAPFSPFYELHHFPSSFDAQPHRVSLATLPHTRTTICPNPHMPTAGIGRLINLSTPRSLSSLLHTLTTYLGHPSSLTLATPQSISAADTSSLPIRTIGICCGSGGSVLGALKDVDLLLTGELVHHEALAAVEAGRCVICLNHSNSERAFLGAVMRPLLEQELKQEWAKAAPAGEGSGKVSVEVSRRDRDPFGYAILKR